jgi:hypothetical protein
VSAVIFTFFDLGGQDVAHGLPHQLGHLTLQVADARFPRVLADHGHQRFVGEDELLAAAGRFLQRLRDQVRRAISNFSSSV